MVITTTMIAACFLLSAAGVAVNECTEEIISLSSCLSYVSYPPNNLTESASEKCCNAFSAAVESRCICYVLRDPLIFGFPLNTTRILSLSSLCPSQTPTSLTFLCSESTALPPLISAPTSDPETAAARSGSRSRSRSRRKRGSSGKIVPTSNGAGIPFLCRTQRPLNTSLFSQILAVLFTLLNT